MKVSILQVDRNPDQSWGWKHLIMHLRVRILNGSLCKARFKTRRSRIGRRHPHRTPCVPNRTGQRCVGRNIVPEPYSWLLAKWVVGESEEAGHRTLSSHGPENPEEKEIALSLKKWVPLALGPAAETKTEDSPPGPPPGEGAVLFSPSPEKEQIPTSLCCPRQGRFINFLDDLGPGWDAGGATLLREARRAGLGVDSASKGAALEDAGGCPR